jgi:general secretion pathway protein A
MYAGFFGLKQEPFSIAPDPRLLFMSERHREALAHLLYGVRGGGGFVLLTGEIGTGKTTVCRSFLEQVPQNVNLAYIFNPKLTVLELLETVCHEFRIEGPRQGGAPLTVKEYLDPLNRFLLEAHAAGRNNVLVIDEAQNLSADVLEQLRLLTNLETSERKLLQIILIGQPELRDMLARPDLEQLGQRVIARYHLQALTEPETAQYVRHRMEVCGLERPLPFDRRALRRVHALAGGVPRRINLLCDRALLGAFANAQGSVNRRIVDQAAAEVFDARPQAARWPRPALVLGLGLAAGAGLFAATQGLQPEPPMPLAAPVVVAPPAPPAIVQVAATAAPPVAPASTTAVLLNDESQAWRELAQAWDVKLPPQGEPCSALRNEQVHCFSRKLNLALIRQLDRPGVITLDAGTTRPSYAVLAGLTENGAILRANGVDQTVPLTALAQRWQGDFGTLWRSPAGYSGRSTGPALEWLTQRVPDIRAFQLAQGLPVDGQPGPMTFMQLNRTAGIEEPRLRKTP